MTFSIICPNRIAGPPFVCALVKIHHFFMVLIVFYSTYRFVFFPLIFFLHSVGSSGVRPSRTQSIASSQTGRTAFSDAAFSTRRHLFMTQEFVQSFYCMNHYARNSPLCLQRLPLPNSGPADCQMEHLMHSVVELKRGDWKRKCRKSRSNLF